MNEDMDIYLSRCLKNWVASRVPRPEGKNMLLEAASTPALAIGRSRIGVFSLVRQYLARNSSSDLGPYDYKYYSLNRNFAIQHAYRSHNEWLMGPGTKSHIWFFHIVTNSRVSA